MAHYVGIPGVYVRRDSPKDAQAIDTAARTRWEGAPQEKLDLIHRMVIEESKPGVCMSAAYAMAPITLDHPDAIRLAGCRLNNQLLMLQRQRSLFQ